MSKIYINSKSSKIYDSTIIVLLFLSAILGSTIFSIFQISIEFILFILFIFGLKRVIFDKIDLLLISLFLLISFLSLLQNDLFTFGLNFKIYGLFILTFIYFKKNNFFAENIFKIALIINVTLIIHQFYFGHFIIQSGWFLSYYKGYANDRPLGLFLIPHASSFFLAIYILYIYFIQKKKGLTVLLFSFLLMTSSLTSLIGLFTQFIFLNITELKTKIKNFYFFKIIFSRYFFIAGSSILIILFFIHWISILDYLKNLGGFTRYYSLEIMVNQVVDFRFFTDIFHLVPRNYLQFLEMQENTFADYANEIGFIKVFVEAGFVLGSLLIYSIFTRFKYLSLFILITFLHYSFLINMPIMAYFICFVNRRLETLSN